MRRRTHKPIRPDHSQARREGGNHLPMAALVFCDDIGTEITSWASSWYMYTQVQLAMQKRRWGIAQSWKHQVAWAEHDNTLINILYLFRIHVRVHVCYRRHTVCCPPSHRPLSSLQKITRNHLITSKMCCQIDHSANRQWAR